MNVTIYADWIISEIRSDIRQPLPGNEPIPVTLAGFAELHDYCDPNDDYLLGVLDHFGLPFDPASEAHAERDNAIVSEVDRRIKAGELR